MIVETPPQPAVRKHGTPEARLQAECWAHAWNHFPETRKLYFAVLNENEQSKYETKQQQRISGARRKSRGVVAGVSDSLLLLPRGQYHGACFEFKTHKGVQSDAQKEWQALVEGAGYYYCIVRDKDDFIAKFSWYLSLQNKK